MARALEGRIALVTGASRGIGVGIARCMAEEGARVAVAARSEAGLKETCRQIEAAGAEALAVPTDVGVEEQVVDMLDRVERAWGPVELLVNNAGVHGDVGCHRDPRCPPNPAGTGRADRGNWPRISWAAHGADPEGSRL